MPTSALILSIAILGGVLVSDLGRHALTTRRILRPLLVVGAAAAVYLGAPATGGLGLALELAGAGVGAALGLAVGALMQVDVDARDGRVYTRAGLPYALVWVAVIGARLTFIYGMQHWFGSEVGSWMFTNHVSVAALTDALVLMALAMPTARTLSIAVRSRQRPALKPVAL